MVYSRFVKSLRSFQPVIREDVRPKISSGLERTKMAPEVEPKENQKGRPSVTLWQWRTVLESTSLCKKMSVKASTWIIPAAICFLTAAVESLIELVEEVSSYLRFGFCKTYFYSYLNADFPLLVHGV